jgi:N-acetylmuramoyl-L-alanine amidase
LSIQVCDRDLSGRWPRLAGAAFLCLLAAVQAGGLRAQELKEPEIIPRLAWGALPAKTELMQEQKPNEIIIHHTGARQQPRVSIEAKMRGLQHFGMTPGRVGRLSKPAWGDIPYHFYIDFAGKIAEGRDITFAGDNTTSIDNDGRIQITVEGDFEREQPAPGQLASLTTLVVWLSAAYGISPEGISGHGDHDQTDCPGRNLNPFLADLRKAVASGEGDEKQTSYGEKQGSDVEK